MKLYNFVIVHKQFVLYKNIYEFLQQKYSYPSAVYVRGSNTC